jgi:hypothetical protein
MLREILKSLKDGDKKILMYALELGNMRYIEYEPGKFIGVNIPKLNNDFRIKEEQNGWSIGTLREATNGNG